jgi:hypothetical protein
MNKKTAILIIVLIGLLGLAAYFYFYQNQPTEEFVTVKGKVQSVAENQNSILITTDNKEWDIKVTEETKMVDREENQLTLEWFNKNWEIQVSGTAQNDNLIIKAREIILLENVNLPEEIKTNTAFEKWLKDWQLIWPEIKPEDFRKTKTDALKATILAADQDQLNAIPNFEQGKVLSPDNKKYLSYIFYWGEPDSNVIIFNREDTSKIEQIAFCGTLCTFEGAFWLDNNRVAVTEISEATNQECTESCPETLLINVFDFNLSEVATYEAKKSTPELKKHLLGLRCEDLSPCLFEYGIYQNSNLAAPLTLRLLYPKNWTFEENAEIKLVDFKFGDRGVSLQIFTQNPTSLISNFVVNPKQNPVNLIGLRGVEITGETLKGDGSKISHTIVARGNFWFVVSGEPNETAYNTMRDSLILK